MVNLDSPLSLYSIPVALLIAYYPHAKLGMTIGRIDGWNNMTPRSNLDKLKESGKVSPEFTAELEQMKGAHANGLETFPLWVAGILAATFAGVDNYTLNTHALAFLALRTLYNYVYLNQKSQFTSVFRTIFFNCSMVMPLSLILRAAQAMGAR